MYKLKLQSSIMDHGNKGKSFLTIKHYLIANFILDVFIDNWMDVIICMILTKHYFIANFRVICSV